jgi:hypothetical protein
LHDIGHTIYTLNDKIFFLCLQKVMLPLTVTPPHVKAVPDGIDTVPDGIDNSCFLINNKLFFIGYCVSTDHSQTHSA